MPEIVVGTYNMSFAGDAGLDPTRAGVYESEAAFHMSNPNKADLRAFWKNAAKFVVEFWKKPNAGVLGLQEMNLTDRGSGTGSGYIETLCKTVHPTLEMETQEVDSGRSKPAVSLMWDTALLGTKVHAKVSALDYIPEEAEGIQADKGRPILFVYTSKGYLLCSLHGPNSDILSRLDHLDMKDSIDKKTREFLGSIGIAFDASRTFLMGDFNDRYDAIQSLTIAGDELGYLGKAPYSCCHNWDSSCSDARYKRLDIPGRVGTGTCKVKKEDGAEFDYVLSGKLPRQVLGSEGDLVNYRYTGDKVFGLNPRSPMTLFRPFDRVASQESDHEMVIATYEIPDESPKNRNDGADGAGGASGGAGVGLYGAGGASGGAGGGNRNANGAAAAAAAARPRKTRKTRKTRRRRSRKN